MLARGAGANGSEPFCRRDVGAAAAGRGSPIGLVAAGAGAGAARVVDVDDPDADSGRTRAGDEAPPGRGSRVRGDATFDATPAGEPAATARIEGVA